MPESAAGITSLGVSDATLVSQPSSGFNRFYGYTVRETAGATAALNIRIGSASGKIIAAITLLANTSQTVWFDDGLIVNGAIYEDTVSGAYAGSIFHA